MSAYYNEIEPFAAQWLRNLIAGGHIAPGDVDERDIRDVHPDDLKGYAQAHFFAGLGGWSHALRLAGWPDDEPIWTGSCPCQPFSAAGAGGGFADERHLWPHFFHLIEQCRPRRCFGEQVASRDGLAWLDLVQSDLEGAGYATAALDLCAAGVGAPHIRQRLYWVADAERERWERRGAGETGGRPAFISTVGSRHAGGLANDIGPGLAQRLGVAGVPGGPGGSDAREAVERGGVRAVAAGHPGPTNGFWRDADWLLCRDGKWRATEPSIFPLADGVSARSGKLRAAGNAIVPQVAEAFIRAYMK